MPSGNLFADSQSRVLFYFCLIWCYAPLKHVARLRFRQVGLFHSQKSVSERKKMTSVSPNVMARRSTFERVSKEFSAFSIFLVWELSLAVQSVILPDDIPFDEERDDDRPFPTGALPARFAVLGAPDGRAKSTSSPALPVRGAGKRNQDVFFNFTKNALHQ